MDNIIIVQLDNVLKKLKSGKAKDPTGFVNELFQKENIGDDLKKSLLILINGVKSEHSSPNFMNDANISLIYKGKGSRQDIENERGIFLLSIIRVIKDKMIHNDIYDEVDSNMSDSQIGSRKNRSIRNHLFILYSIINEAIQNAKNQELDFFKIKICFSGVFCNRNHFLRLFCN